MIPRSFFHSKNIFSKGFWKIFAEKYHFFAQPAKTNTFWRKIPLKSVGVIFFVPTLIFACHQVYEKSVKTGEIFSRELKTLPEAEEEAGNEKRGESEQLPEEFVQKMQEKFGDRFCTNLQERERHSKDYSFHASPAICAAIIYPLTVSEIQFIIKECRKARIPIVSYGSGTSLEGHTHPVLNPSICLNMSRRSQILAFHPRDLDLTVMSGATWEEVNAYLGRYGFFFPVDPGQGASIGGMVGTSCSGMNAVRYGTMRERVLNLTVVLASGEVVVTGQRARKSSAGYDLTHLFIGSEGTLGVIADVTLKIERIPQNRAVVVSHFPSIRSAGQVVARIRLGHLPIVDPVDHVEVQQGKNDSEPDSEPDSQKDRKDYQKEQNKGEIEGKDEQECNFQLARIELLDDSMIRALNKNSGYNYPELSTIFFEFHGSEEEIENQIRRVRKIAESFHAVGFQAARKPTEIEKLWQARRDCLWAAKALHPSHEIMITDICVPVSKLPETIDETKADILETGLTAPLVGHVGDGNFHLFILVDPTDAAHMARVEQFNHRLVMRAIQKEGTCSGEHGVGVGKSKYLEAEHGKNAVDLMRVIKNALDPTNIMNPGKVLPPLEE